eukprot:TRINITY_DN162_c0_g4_i1.p1 TRINITY_DN162_c0_g4~~TRINITY_DN162_c0_g4_i1.p1  ORF type:complete len:214 (-),score=99.91 TRINITY_DN162_c0_g4_i1:143-784(-)
MENNKFEEGIELKTLNEYEGQQSTIPINYDITMPQNHIYNVQQPYLSIEQHQQPQPQQLQQSYIPVIQMNEQLNNLPYETKSTIAQTNTVNTTIYPIYSIEQQQFAQSIASTYPPDYNINNNINNINNNGVYDLENDKQPIQPGQPIQQVIVNVIQPEEHAFIIGIVMGACFGILGLLCLLCFRNKVRYIQGWAIAFVILVVLIIIINLAIII